MCGEVRYRVTEEPLTLYACHCTDCQTRSGSAFGLSMWVDRTAIEITAGQAELHARTIGGKVRKRRICAQCGTNLFSEPREGSTSAIVRPGTLDDTSWLHPVAHMWTRSAQPWVVFPAGAKKYEQQPADFAELVALWRDRPT